MALLPCYGHTPPRKSEEGPPKGVDPGVRASHGGHLRVWPPHSRSPLAEERRNTSAFHPV